MSIYGSKQAHHSDGLGNAFQMSGYQFFRQVPLRNILNLMSSREQDVLVALSGSPTAGMARPKYSVTDG